MLRFSGAWRFDSPGAIPAGVVAAFFELITKVVRQGERQKILEHFKTFFGSAAGISGGWSSNAGWAEYDLQSYMDSAAANAPLFIEAFYDACIALATKYPEIALPDVARINRILFENQAGYEIQPPNLISSNTPQIIPVPEHVPSLDEQAQELIQQSLNHSEKLLSEGLSKQAVQETLWLLETVSTAFKGLATDVGTIQGKYFNKIAEDLRNRPQGTVPRTDPLMDDHPTWLPLVSYRRRHPTRRRPEEGYCDAT